MLFRLPLQLPLPASVTRLSWSNFLFSLARQILPNWRAFSKCGFFALYSRCFVAWYLRSFFGLLILRTRCFAGCWTTSNSGSSARRLHRFGHSCARFFADGGLCKCIAFKFDVMLLYLKPLFVFSLFRTWWRPLFVGWFFDVALAFQPILLLQNSDFLFFIWFETSRGPHYVLRNSLFHTVVDIIVAAKYAT